MKIAPIPSTANLAPMPTEGAPTAVQNFRALKMRTNANPTDYSRPEEEDPKQTLANSPTNDQAMVVEDTQPISPQFAALAKQRRVLQEKERALAERERALENQSGQGDSIAIARLRSEPLNVLLEAGVTYEDLTQAILNNQGNSELISLRQDFKTHKEEVQNLIREKEEAAERNALDQMGMEAKELVDNTDDFELIRSLGHLPDVTRLIKAYWDAERKIMPVKEACQLIEEKLFEDAQKVAGLQKVQSSFASSAQAPTLQQQPGLRTLTNRDTATVPMSAKQRAIAVFNGTMKR